MSSKIIAVGGVFTFISTVLIETLCRKYFPTSSFRPKTILLEISVFGETIGKYCGKFIAVISDLYGLLKDYIFGEDVQTVFGGIYDVTISYFKGFGDAYLSYYEKVNTPLFIGMLCTLLILAVSVSVYNDRQLPERAWAWGRSIWYMGKGRRVIETPAVEKVRSVSPPARTKRASINAHG